MTLLESNKMSAEMSNLLGTEPKFIEKSAKRRCETEMSDDIVQNSLNVMGNGCVTNPMEYPN